MSRSGEQSESERDQGDLHLDPQLDPLLQTAVLHSWGEDPIVEDSELEILIWKLRIEFKGSSDSTSIITFPIETAIESLRRACDVTPEQIDILEQVWRGEVEYCFSTNCFSTTSASTTSTSRTSASMTSAGNEHGQMRSTEGRLKEVWRKRWILRSRRDQPPIDDDETSNRCAHVDAMVVSEPALLTLILAAQCPNLCSVLVKQLRDLISQVNSILN